MTDTATLNQATTAGERLRAAREQAGLSRNDLAEKTDLTLRIIEKFEQGLQEPNLSRLVAICEALGCSTDHIAFGTDDAPEHIDHQDADYEDERGGNPVLSIFYETRAAGLLIAIDEMRVGEFSGNRRKLGPMVGDLEASLRYLDPEELIDLAIERDIAKLSDGQWQELASVAFENATDDQKHQLDAVGKRIIDTALFGVDLETMTDEQLEALDDQLSGKPFVQLFEGKDLISGLRMRMRSAITEGGPIFDER
ncbi:MAG: helix-turn-helix transcriptional regulator [Alphaproteobacteria bacterium]|nr:helix-turn-helix transcriptional regulator [Alphaproteobacteria bacterium SS10]